MKFIDLFCGIGGFRTGFEKNGFQCVFSSDFDINCQNTYEKNFGERPFGDITQIDPKEIPDFEVLVGGFPCQPFSISGKKLGFEDTRGTLFFDVCRIIKEKNPKVVVLENVQHFVKHDKGRTLKVVLTALKDLGYNVSYEVLNTNQFGLPQHRERVFIVASKHGLFNFDLIKKTRKVPLKDFIDSDGDFEFLSDDEYTILPHPRRQANSGLIFIGYRNKNRFTTKGIRPGTDHLSRVHRQPNRIYSVEGCHPTLPSQESNGRFFIYLTDKNKVRKLTIRECYRIMGFPENFILHDSLGVCYKQIGNSVSINVIDALAKEILNQNLLSENESQTEATGDLRKLLYF